MTTARLPIASRVAVVSDLHLGDGGPSDGFRKKDDLFRAFLDRVASRADALVIAGDGFDLAQGWTLDRIVEAHRGVVDDLVALSRVVDVVYLAGNHEGSAAALTLPFEYAHALEIGDRIRIEHGNAYDPHNLPGDRAAFWGARAHATLEGIIRAPVRIPMRKHHRWSTRIGHWIFYNYGAAQRALAGRDLAAGREDRARQRLDFLDYWGRGEWGDAHGLVGAAQAVLASGELDVLIFGHSHQPGKVTLPGGVYANTGSWTEPVATYAMIDGGHVEVRTFPDHRLVGDDQYRGILGPHAGKSFFEWWEAHYRGWLRYDVEAMDRHARGEP